MQSEWSSVEDSGLLLALRAGKLAAFSELVDRHQRSLINFFYHLGSDRHAAEDGAQEVFLRLYRHAATYEPQAKFTTFLYRIARNLWIDRVRSQAARGGKAVSLESEGGPGGERALRDRLAGPSPTPVEILERQETEAALKRAIELLPEEQRTVLVLSEMQGLKYQEIGAILEIPVGTVKSRMHTAMERLKEMMAEDLG